MERKSSGLRTTARFFNRLGVTSLFLGIGAALIKAWVTYWLGPGHGPRPEPVQTAVVQTPAAATVKKPRTVEDLLLESPVSLTQWQTEIEQYRAASVSSNGLGGETPEQRERRFRPWFGKVVTWEGYFKQFNAHPHPEAPQQPCCTLIMHESYASLHSDSLLGPPFIRCFLPISAQSQLSQLKAGQWIVVRGRLSNPLLAGSLLCTDLTECQLVAESEIRSVEMAVVPAETVVR